MDFDEEEGAGDEGTPAWMATFGDLMSLLLTFFVLLLSFANMDIVKFRDMMGSVQDAFGVQEDHPGDREGLTTSAVELSTRESTAVLDLLELPTRQAGGDGLDQEMLESIQRMLSDEGMDETMDVELSERGVVLRVKGALLFDAGSAGLRREAHTLLDEIATVAGKFPYRLLIEGHTDDIPVRTPEYPTNWHLSAARAIAALRYFSEEGKIDPKRLAATGYADMQPIVPNDSREHRAINRRIEFVFQRDESSDASGY